MNKENTNLQTERSLYVPGDYRICNCLRTLLLDYVKHSKISTSKGCEQGHKEILHCWWWRTFDELFLMGKKVFSEFWPHSFLGKSHHLKKILHCLILNILFTMMLHFIGSVS